MVRSRKGNSTAEHGPDVQNLLMGQELIVRIATDLTGRKHFPDQVDAVLRRIGEHTNVSRVYIFEDDENGESTSNTFEWCNEGIAAQRPSLQDIPYNSIPSWKTMLEGQGRVVAEDIATLPEDLVEVLESQGILSIVVYPLFIDDRIGGFIGFDECMALRRWTQSELDLLRILSGLLSTAFSRERFQRRLEESELNYRTLFDSIDDLLFVLDADGLILHANKAAGDKLGYGPAGLVGMHVLDIHPQEYRAEAQSIVDMIRGERKYCPLPLFTRGGGLVPVETRVWAGVWSGRDVLFGISKDRSTEAALLEKFNRLFDNNPSPMAVSALPERVFTHVNKAFLDTLGYAYAEVIGKGSADLGLFVDQEQQREIAELIEVGGQATNMELQVRRKDGKILQGLFSGAIIDEQTGKSLLSVMVDITRQVELQRDAEEQRYRIANILAGTNAGTWEWEIQTGEVVFNERWADIIGYTLEELQPITIGTWLNLVHSDDLIVSEKNLAKHFSGENEYYSCDARMRHKNGEWIWVRDHGQVAAWNDDGSPQLMYGTHIDITDIKRAEEKVREISIRDPLTGLYNRRHAMEVMNAMVSKCNRGTNAIAVAILDLDHFKAVNDTYGHLAGDEVLRAFAELLTKSIRPFDLASRYGGEEFLLVFENTDFRHVVTIIERILKSFRNHEWTFDGQSVRLTFSCGLAQSAEFEAHELTVETLIKKADSRLYVAKGKGRNRLET